MSVRSRSIARLAPVVLVLLAMAAAAGAQDRSEASGDTVPEDGVPSFPSAAPVPYGPGERLEFEVKMGVFSVGDGALEVAGVDTVRGFPAYRLVMTLQGGIPMARVDDRFESWLDVHEIVSRRFHQRIREAGYESDRHYEIFPEEQRWSRTDEENEEEMPTSFPLDDLSFMYFVRTLDLTPGKEYRSSRYFKSDGNPVVVKVERRDTVEVPAGTFPTVVVRPVIQTDGMFSEGGEAELHFTDDEAHHLVYMRVKIPVVRSMTLHLKSLETGTSVIPEQRVEEDRPAGSAGDDAGGRPPEP